VLGLDLFAVLQEGWGHEAFQRQRGLGWLIHGGGSFRFREEGVVLRIPETFRSVDDVLGAASKLDLENCIVISERGDGSLVFLATEVSAAQANWLLDRIKALLCSPEQPMRSPSKMARGLAEWQI
jgi:hypothetical protein